MIKVVKKWYENDKRKLIELYRKLIELYRKLIEFLKKGGNK